MGDLERLGPDAWEVYRDVRLASLADAPHAFGSRLEIERRRTESEWRGRLSARTQFIVIRDGRPRGTVGCRPDVDGELELVSMWVAPDARGQGLGARLVRAVLDEARTRADGGVVLWVAEGNVRAEELYVRHGFARTGRTQPIDDDEPGRGVEFEMRRTDPSTHGPPG
jgi:GNAT superfamily N-acetyltransferase